MMADGWGNFEGDDGAFAFAAANPQKTATQSQLQLDALGLPPNNELFFHAGHGSTENKTANTEAKLSGSKQQRSLETQFSSATDDADREAYIQRLLQASERVRLGKAGQTASSYLSSFTVKRALAAGADVDALTMKALTKELEITNKDGPTEFSSGLGDSAAVRHSAAPAGAGATNYTRDSTVYNRKYSTINDEKASLIADDAVDSDELTTLNGEPAAETAEAHERLTTSAGASDSTGLLREESRQQPPADCVSACMRSLSAAYHSVVALVLGNR
jgi:hypothetical protein